MLFLYPRFLEMLEHISQLPYKIPLEKVHRPISPLISILALLVPYFVPTFILIIVLNAVSVIAFIVLYITRNIKESSSTNFNALNKIKTKAKDDLPNVIDLSKFSSKSLNYYSRQVSYYIKLIESKDKILANLLPILALIYAVSFISFILRSDPKTSTSFFNISWLSTLVSELLVFSSVFLVVLKAMSEFNKQRSIRPLEECLIVIEQALLLANKANS